MATHQGKRVSQKWAVALRAAEDAGIRFLLTSGQRTMGEQQRLVDQKGVWSPSNNKGAARPNPNAPHIRQGRDAHALDINSLDGGETRLQQWLRSEGVSAENTVPGEDWHLEVSEAGLDKLYRRYKASHGFPNPYRRRIREYDRLVRQGRDRKRQAVLKKTFREDRKKFWNKPKSAKLYLALLKRSR